MEFIRENLLKIVVFIVILIVVVIVFAFFLGGSKKKTEVSYSSMEQSMINSAMKYLKNNTKLFPSGDEVTKVNLDTLENEDYISKLYAIEEPKIKCTGYINVTDEEDYYLYTPYLKCGNYYETKTLANYIKDNEPIVTSGDGLYNMNGIYVFRGEHPNNYVFVGDRVYRIIEINGNYVKLISNKKINSSFVWDDRYNSDKQDYVGINTYSVSRLKEQMNNLIKYNSTTEGDVNNYFSEQEIEKMAEYDICTGKRDFYSEVINSDVECQQVEPKQKISLINVSDYARASIDSNCTNVFSKSCTNYNYFSDINRSFRTITGITNNTYQILMVSGGVVSVSKASSSFSPNIVIYLDDLSLYYSGDGSYDNPYSIR